MTTYALDVATIFHALNTLEKEYLGEGRSWRTYNDWQNRLFALYGEYRDTVERLHGLKAKASTDWTVLNAFLTAENFDPMFSGPLNGIGVVSILDKFVKWVLTGQVTTILAQNGQTYPAFEFPDKRSGVYVYQLSSYSFPLAELRTQSDDTLYLMMADRALTGIAMIEMIIDLISKPKRLDERFEGARIPKIDFNVKPDISWLCGADTTTASGGWMYIAEAYQQFMFRMNEIGARAKVATGIAMRGGPRIQTQRLVFDQPFYGFFLQSGVPTPLACFYADYDSWKEPAGSLEDL